jgi:OOP family OmpA-OmpF porin
MLANGAVTVTPGHVSLRGTSTRENAKADISGLLSDKLGSAESFDLDITFRAPPDPVAEAPSAETCEARLAAAQENGKINFEPGSANIAADSLDTMNSIAEILGECGDLRLEIQGHTDSQGREEMNKQLSQARAQSVLNELRARRVLTSSFVAVRYGETRPIAENDTEEGREDNRRIEFRLIRPDPPVASTTTLESIEEPTDAGDLVEEGTDNEQN